LASIKRHSAGSVKFQVNSIEAALPQPRAAWGICPTYSDAAPSIARSSSLASPSPRFHAFSHHADARQDAAFAWKWQLILLKRVAPRAVFPERSAGSRRSTKSKKNSLSAQPGTDTYSQAICSETEVARGEQTATSGAGLNRQAEVIPSLSCLAVVIAKLR
jgi:hypothetical protein